MTSYAHPLHLDVNSKVTSAKHGDPTDAAEDTADEWYLHIRAKDGAIVTLGDLADVANPDPDATTASIVAILKGLLAAPAITRTAYTAGAIACDRLHGYAVQNTSVTDDDVAEILIRFGNAASSTPFIPVRLAPGESATLYTERGIAVGGSGIYVDTETAPAGGAIEGVVFTS